MKVKRRKESFSDTKNFELFKDNVKAIGGPGIIGSNYRNVLRGGLHESPGLGLHGHQSVYQNDV